MTKTAANIVVGAPTTVKIGAYGAGEGSAVDVGSTEGGLKIISAPEWYFKTADQWIGKVGAVKIGEDFTAEVILAEATLANLALAMGYPLGALSGSTLDIGGNETVTLKEMFIVGNGPRGSSRLITVHKMVITGATEVPLVKGDKTGIKLTIQMLQDTGKSANKQYFSIVDSAWDDSTAPTVAMDVPAEDGNVTKGSSDTVTLQFTEDDSAMDEGSLIYGNTVIISDVTDGADTKVVAGSFVYSAATKKLIFTPDPVWDVAGSKKYQVMITTAVRDTAGNPLAAVFYGHFLSTA